MPAKPDEYFLLLDGETSGPHSLEELHQMWQDQRIALDTLYVQPGMKGCRPVNLILNKVIGFQKPTALTADPAQSILEGELELGETGSMGPLYVLVAVCLGLVIWLVASVFQPPPDPSKALNAELDLSLTHLTVFNVNDYAWREKTIILNGRPPNGFKLKVHALNPHESLTLSLPDFVNDTGSRFVPWGMKVEEVWIGDEETGYRYFNPPRPTSTTVPPPPPPPPIQ